MRTILISTLALLLAFNAAAQDRGAVMASDYVTTAYVTGLDLADPWQAGPLPGEPVFNDAVMRWHDDLVWVVNRGGADNVQVLDPAQGFATVRQFSLGLGRNLQDIAFADDGTAYVSCYDEPELLHVDPQTGTIQAVLSTANFADTDGLPETGWLLYHAGRLFVTCQRLDRDNWYAPVGDSYVLALDTATNQWLDAAPQVPGVQGIALVGANPYTSISADGDELLVGCVGYYGMQDGGIERIDPVALVSLGQEIDETALGGDLIDVVVTGTTRHVLVADATWTTHLKRYAPGGAAATLISGSGNYDLVDLAFDHDFQVFLADRRVGAAGVRVFDAVSGAELTTAPIGVGLAPSSIALPPAGPVVGVGDVTASSLTLSAPWPNPANPMTQVEFTAPAGRLVTLRLIDLRGRLVRSARVQAGADGRGRWIFDGRDRRGHDVASGVYRCVVEDGDGYAARSLTIVR